MTRYLAGVLTVIAGGVLLVAYGLLNPRDMRADAALLARPAYAGDRIVTFDDGTTGYARLGPAARALPVSDIRDVSDDAYAPVRRPTSVARPISYRPASAPSSRVVRSSGRDWTKTALVIGGSTAAGAGLGAIFGGKKGALIGAAVGGGASTLWEAKQR